MSEWEVVPDAPSPAGGDSEWSVVPDAAPAPAPRSFLDRVGDRASQAAGAVGRSFANLGHTVASAARGAVDLVSPISKEGGLQVPFGQLADPAYRHQLERGISDTVTGGLAEKAANAVSPEFAASAAPDAAAAPDARALGNVAGTALPSPFSYLGGQAARLVPGAGPLAAGAKGLVSYEASAIPQAAIAAPEGHRLEAAREAATDPAGIVTSATIPAVTSFLQKKLDVAASRAPEVQEAAKRRAVKDLGKDITSAEGVKSRVTDQKRIAEVNDRLYDLADKNPELRQAFSEPAEKALPKVREFKAKIAGPLDRLYDAIDEKTGGGIDARGVVADLRRMAKDARTPGVAEAPVAGIGDAKRLNDLANQFEEVYVNGNEALAPAAAPATQQHGAGKIPPGMAEHLQALETLRKNAKGVAADALDRQIAHAKDVIAGRAEKITLRPLEPEVREPNPFDEITEAEPKGHKTVGDKTVGSPAAKREVTPAETAETVAAAPPAPAPAEAIPAGKIPTRTFRREVTELLKKSDSVMGGIEGTPRFEALQKLYDAGKQIIDKHIDNSGLPPEQIAQIRDINNGYFLLSRAEDAIESRGFKEANKPGFQFPHTIKQAVHGGGLGAIATAAAMAGPHAAVHALPYVAGATLATHALPKIAKTVNWELAHGAYGRVVNRLVDVARKMPRSEFIGQAARAGLGVEAARKIYDAANAPAQQGATP